ncbi:unnamed protein product [Spirodela intermedia]|uniref:O-fucosyltransferase family protein n=1 Tax=Spirodela intermedia TaxID=51605 RepID=A0A7I8L8A5_SPIIN|nr:unnamed protein product [Spirodela intermedia]
MNHRFCNCQKVFQAHTTLIYRLSLFLLLALVLRTAVVSSYHPGFLWFKRREIYWSLEALKADEQSPVRSDKFLEVPQIVWGLNNQKIAFARASLTARLLNRTLLMPSLSASLFYKEMDRLQPIAFDKVFDLRKFNNLCGGFVRVGRASEVSDRTKPIEIQKGSGRKWTAERDLNQLKEIQIGPDDGAEVIRIVGKNPFLWLDHWPVKQYARIFDCLVLIDEIADAAAGVIAKIRAKGLNSRSGNTSAMARVPVPYMAVHMRIEKDWMIHCKHLERRSNTNQICSSKEEIMARVGSIPGLIAPMVTYIAVADALLEDGSILRGWKEGLVPVEKKMVGAWETYQRWPYLVRSAIDYEVCLRAEIFVGNSYSTFSSLVVLERTQRRMREGGSDGGGGCGGGEEGWASYAYNLGGEQERGIRKWETDMEAPSLQAISYGTSNISCHR